MAATTAITTAALSNVFISASQCPEGNLLKTGPECKRTRAKARDYIWESTFGMARVGRDQHSALMWSRAFSPRLEIGHLCGAWSRNSPPGLGGVPRAINSSLESERRGGRSTSRSYLIESPRSEPNKKGGLRQHLFRQHL